MIALPILSVKILESLSPSSGAPRYLNLGSLAQSVEQLAFNQLVDSSNLSRPTNQISFQYKLAAEDSNEREEIIADIQEMVDACAQPGNAEYPFIKFNDLETIALHIREFKDSLLHIVIEKGGINQLADLTGIPQPSLSRFFNSNAMPQRSTLLKISKALKLDAVQTETPWSR